MRARPLLTLIYSQARLRGALEKWLTALKAAAEQPMTAAIWILSVPLIAEFAFASVNLWTGRTIGNYTRFTGLPTWSTTRILAPVKLASAILPAVGLAVRAPASPTWPWRWRSLARLAGPGRRDLAGLTGFAVFGALACAVLALRLST